MRDSDTVKVIVGELVANIEWVNCWPSGGGGLFNPKSKRQLVKPRVNGVATVAITGPLSPWITASRLPGCTVK